MKVGKLAIAALAFAKLQSQTAENNCWKRYHHREKGKPTRIKLTEDQNKKNKQKYVSLGQFLSKELRFFSPGDDNDKKRKGKALRQRLTRWGRKTAEFMILNKHFEDAAKAPINNVPKSSVLSIQAMNSFYSVNKVDMGGGCIARQHYDYVSANVTGLDQREVKIRSIFPELAKMMELIQNALVDSGYNLQNLSIDMISVKAYYRFYDTYTKRWVTKVLNPHTDVKYDPDGSSNRDNNQQPGLPVVIYNIGSKKLLHFQLRNAYDDSPIPGEEFWVEQRDGHCFVLNAQDEVPAFRGKNSDNTYLSYWAHDSKLVDNDGVAISIQFRFGKPGAVVPVDAGTARFKNPQQSATTSARFDAVKEAPWLSGPAYEAAIEEVYNKLRSKFVNSCNKT